MSRQDQVNDDVVRVARAIALLRNRYGLSQDHVAEAHPKKVTKQYWSMHETGQVPGIVKPDTQRGLLEAISKAAELDDPLTLDDLADAMEAAAPATASPREARAIRMARSFGPPRAVPPAAAGRQAIFPLSTGDAVIQLPAEMTPDAFDELEAYLKIFLKANAPKD